MAAFIQKKQNMKKQKTTDLVEQLCDATKTKTSSNNWKVQKPVENTTDDDDNDGENNQAACIIGDSPSGQTTWNLSNW